MNKSLYPKALQLAATFLVLLTVSCTKEEFSATKNESNPSFSGPTSSTQTECGRFTHIKPPVDFLFLWDNTSSQLFINDATKAALTNTINLISDRFDYRILMAPLVINSSQSTNHNTVVVSDNDYGLSADALSRRVPGSEAGNSLANYTIASSSDERGIERASQLITANVSHGLFRQNSYVIVVLMSNENDYRTTSFGFPDGAATDAYLQTQMNAFVNLRDNVLNSEQIRFISMVAHQNGCLSGSERGSNYELFSQSIYAQRYQPSVPLQFRVDDQKSRTDSGQPADSYDICNSDFLHLFDGINSSITDVVIKHKYNFWPVSEVQSPLTFEPESIRVFKGTTEFPAVAGSGNGDGFEYVGFMTNQPTRFEPTSGEERSAHMLALYGNAQVTFPECLKVSYDSPTYFYGYVKLDAKPTVSSIELRINGVVIPQSASNGWEYIGFRENLNVKIQGPNNPQNTHQEALPEEFIQNKFFLKVNGSAIYKNGDSVNVTFLPSGT